MATINLITDPNATATAERDLVIGTLEADIAFGLDGNDAINGSSGHDLLFGNRGNDNIHGNQDNDTIYGGKGEDSVYGDNDHDVLFGNLAEDILNGGSGDDTLYGGQENDNLTGGGGDDVLSGDKGLDYLMGNDGIDMFVLQPGGGADYIVDLIDQRDIIGLGGGLSFDQITISTVDKKSINTISIAHTKANDITITITATGEVIGVIKSSVLGVSEDLTPFNFDQSDLTSL